MKALLLNNLCYYQIQALSSLITVAILYYTSYTSFTTQHFPISELARLEADPWTFADVNTYDVHSDSQVATKIAN
jgi:hypothetical protein